MSIFDGVLQKFGYVRKAAVSNAPPFLLDYAGANEFAMPSPIKAGAHADYYRVLSWMQIAVNTCAVSGSAQGLSVKQAVGEDAKDIANHPFEKLILKPNPLQSRAEFLSGSFADYKLTGNCYWWTNRGSESQPAVELWRIPPEMIIPVPDDKMFIRGYYYYPGDGQEMLLEPWEIVHFKTYNPHSLLVGLSPIEALINQARADMGRTKNEAKIYNEENGRLPSVLAFAQQYSDPQWESIKTQIRDREQKRQMMLIHGVGDKAIQWLQNSLTAEEAQYLESRAFTRDEIYAVFAPGLASMLDTNATEANSKTGKATFAEYSLWPMLDTFAQRITNDLLEPYGENLIAEFDDPRTKDRILEMQEQQEYAKTHTIAEVRKKYYQDEPLGDERDTLLVAQVTPDAGAQPEQPEIPPMTPLPDETMPPMEPEANEPEPMPAMAEDLEKWKRKAINALKRGKSPAVDFDSANIPDGQYAAIRAALEGCETQEQVKAAFTAQPEHDPDGLARALKRANEILTVFMEARQNV